MKCFRTFRFLVQGLILFGSVGLVAGENKPTFPDWLHKVEYRFPGYVQGWDDKKCDLFYGKCDAIYLNGWWKLAKLKGTENNPRDDYGTRNGFFKAQADTSDWDTIFVPWNWCEGKEQDRFGGVGWYRRTFTVPAGFKDRRLILRFSQVLSEASVWINGHPAGKYKMYSYSEWFGNTTYAAFSLEITDRVNFGGGNSIAVRVYHNPNKAWLGGMFRPVQIDAVPKVFVDQILVTPQVEKKQLDVRCRFDNGSGGEAALNLMTRLAAWKSYRYTSPDTMRSETHNLGTVRLPKGITERQFTIPVSHPTEWTYERPNLYHLKVLADENLIGQTRFGYRQVAIRGVHFYLNGKKMWLPADELCPPMSIGNNIFTFNQDLDKESAGYGGSCFGTGAVNLTEWLERYKKANLVVMRAHSDCWTEPMFDLADEVGIMVYPELLHVNDSFRPKDEGGETVFDEYARTKKLADGYKQELRGRLEAHWNHPSVWAFSLGNELYALWYTPILCDLYDFVKKQVGPPFPVAQSGRYYSDKSDDAFTSRPDFYDDHFYWGLEVEWPAIDKFCAGLGSYIHGKLDRPWYNGEGFGVFEPWHYDWVFKELKAKLPEIDRATFARLCNRTEKDLGEYVRTIWTDARRQMMMYGVRDFLAEHERGMPRRGEYYKRYAEAHRRWNQYVSGFATHRVHPIRQECMNAFGRIMTRVNSPLYVCTDIYYRHHYLAGQELSTEVFTFNDTLGDVSDVRVKIDLVGPEKQIVFSRGLYYEKMDQGQTQVTPLTWKIPGDLKTGHYTLLLTLSAGGREVLRNDYAVYILGSDQRRTTIDVKGKKVALYVKPAGLKGTQAILDGLKVRYERLEKFDRLGDYEIMIVGTDSFGPELKQAGAGIRVWIERGGKVLCFEQADYLGAVPFAREYRIAETEPTVADVLVPRHPAFDGLEAGDWDMWDGDYGVLTRKYIIPLADTVLVSAGLYGANFGMVAAEARIGKGVALFSQAEATTRYGKDSVATRYLENLLHYAVEAGWEDCKVANYTIPAISGKPQDTCEIEPLDPARAAFVDLRAVCNRSFRDEKGGDGVGGWFDEGGGRGMMDIPFGTPVFAGVPFQIIDPAKNGGHAIIVLNTNGNGRFLKGNRLDEVRIPVEKTMKRLVFLTASAWNRGDGSTAAELVVKFAGGKSLYETEIIPVKSGINLGDWWIADGLLPEGKLAWSYYDQGLGRKVGLYMFEWKNRQPQAVIREIIFRTKHKETIPALVAVTGEKE